jgi:hypothetical protein
LQAGDVASVDQTVGGLLRTLGCPMSPPATGPAMAAAGMGAQQELLYAAPADALLKWLQSSNVLVALGNIWAHCDGANRCDGLQIISEDAIREARCMQAAAAAQVATVQHPVAASAMPAAYLLQRPELVQLLLRSAPILGLLRDYGHDAVALLDRVMCTPGGAAAPANLMAASCLAICAPAVSGARGTGGWEAGG